jgi:IclR family transcriptional regulator, acetate operon repressor
VTETIGQQRPSAILATPRGTADHRLLATSVLRRAFAVLGAFDDHPSRLTLAELARNTGLPKTTVHRLAAELVGLGVLERRPGGYVLGCRLFELGQRVPRQRQLRDVALPFMQDLYETTRETTQLAVMERFEVLLVEILYGHRHVKTPTTRGARMPFHSTGLGKAMIAFSSQSVIEQALELPLTARTPRTVTDPGALRDELARIRRERIAYDWGESERGVLCAAAPIMGPNGTAFAAVSVSMSHRSRLHPREIVPSIQHAAIRISRAAQQALVVT